MNDSDQYSRWRRNRKRQKCDNFFEKHSSSASGNSCSPDSKGAWLCVSMLIVLDKSADCCQQVYKSGLFEWENDESHDYRFSASLLYSYTSCEGKLGSIQSNDSFSIFSSCTKLILEGRDEANFSSPFHMWGFQTCGKLMTKRAQNDWSIGLDEIECNYVLGVIHPKNFTKWHKEHASASKTISGAPSFSSLFAD